MINLNNVPKRTKSKTEFLGCRADPETTNWLKAYCIKRKVSISGVILELIRALKLDVEAKEESKAAENPIIPED